MKKFFPRKWSLTLKVIPYVIVIVVIKYFVTLFNIDFLTLSPLFTALISANIFLIGFLISGVLVDYKESEKLPGELAASMETILDECLIVYTHKKAKVGKEFTLYIKDFNSMLLSWFNKEERTTILMNKLDKFSDYFYRFEEVTQPPFIARLKQEQSLMRKNITRIHTIRETSFNQSAYMIVELITFILIAGLVFVNYDPFHESAFFVGFVTFILIYMIFLIKDLDNPFGYYEDEQLADEVSLKPLLDLKRKMENL